MNVMKAAAAILTLTVLAACAQPEPVEVTPDPVYDKYGNVVS